MPQDQRSAPPEGQGKEVPTPKSPAEIAQEDQQEAQLRTFARQLGLFYKELKAAGIPAGLAGDLTRTFNDCIFGVIRECEDG